MLFNFPEKETIAADAQATVFYIGYRYIGPMFCQDIQQLYLKRKVVEMESDTGPLLPIASMTRAIQRHIHLNWKNVKKMMYWI